MQLGRRINITEKSGVYLIGNKLDRKMYIGASSNLKRRLTESRNKLRLGQHHSKLLQKAFNKESEDNFAFIVLEETENYIKREQYWCDYYKATDLGYNIRKQTHTNKGNTIVFTQETRDRISKALKGKIPSNLIDMQRVRHTPVNLYIDNVFSQSFGDQREAARETGVEFHAINNQLRGATSKIRQFPNYIFKYKKETT